MEIFKAKPIQKGNSLWITIPKSIIKKQNITCDKKIRLIVFDKSLRKQLDLWRKKKITLRTLAKNLGISIWEAQELIIAVEHPYSRADLQRDLKLI